MATSCDHCGHRDNEVKSGTGISEYGTMINLRLVDPSDLSRDILKVCVILLSEYLLFFLKHTTLAIVLTLLGIT